MKFQSLRITQKKTKSIVKLYNKKILTVFFLLFSMLSSHMSKSINLVDWRKQGQFYTGILFKDRPFIENLQISNPSKQVNPILDVQSFSVKEDGSIEWEIYNENGLYSYQVEQFFMDRWIQIGKLEGKGISSHNAYSIKVTLSSGSNKFRVKQVSEDQKSRFSLPFLFTSNKLPVICYVKNSIIEFSDETYFFVFDAYGSIIKKGDGNFIDISKYEKGLYYLLYDNKFIEFTKKSGLIYLLAKNR